MSAKPNNGGGGGPLWVTARGGRWSTGPGIRQLHGSDGDECRSGGVWRHAGGGADGARGLRASAWAACERVGRPGRKRWAEPKETIWFWIYLN
jgi:hypothetical protein